MTRLKYVRRGSTKRVATPPPAYPYIRKGGVVRLPKFLVLGSNKTTASTDAFEGWWSACLLTDFPDTTYVRDNADWSPTGGDPIGNYDALFFVVDGNAGFQAPSYLATVASWVTTNGGGLVSACWQLYNAVNWITEWSALDPACPAIYGPFPQSYGTFDDTSGFAVVDGTHPTARTLSDPIPTPAYPSAGGWGIEYSISAKPGCTVVANERYTDYDGTHQTQPAVIAGPCGAGRGVYLEYTSYSGGGVRPATNTQLAQLFRNAMWWAAGGA